MWCVFLHFGAIFDWTRGKFGFLRHYFSGFFPCRSHAVKFYVVQLFLKRLTFRVRRRCFTRFVSLCLVAFRTFESLFKNCAVVERAEESNKPLMQLCLHMKDQVHSDACQSKVRFPLLSFVFNGIFQYISTASILFYSLARSCLFKEPV